MKVIYTVGIAVLLCIVATWWFTGSEEETNAMPVPAASSDFDASQQMGGNVETLQGSRQPVTPSRESTAGSDLGSGSAMSAPADRVTLSAPETQQLAVNLTRFHGLFAPNSNLRSQVTLSGRGKPRQAADSATPAERHRALRWAQRLKRVSTSTLSTAAYR